MPRLNASLNPSQRAAVETTEGAVLVLAGAGTGKTRVVIERIAHLLQRKRVPAGAILAVTFTNKAAAEMRERLAERIGKRAPLREMILSTFHSLCVRILREDAERAGLRRRFTICDGGEQLSLARSAQRGVAGLDRLRPEDLTGRISRFKSAGLSPAAALRGALEERDHAVAAVYRRYEEALRLRNAVDFDDLLLYAARLLRTDEEVRAKWQARARYILVDEFQDTSDVQLELLRLLGAGAGNVCVVGDDDQSIYSWRGARPKNLLEFGRHFPGAKTIRLEENYRSTESILHAANALIATNGDRVGKTLWSRLGAGDPVEWIEAEDPDEEAELVVRRIRASLAEEGTKPSDHAILVRTNGQTRPFEEELRQQKIPYVVIGGTSFFDRKEIRDVLAYLQAAANPRDEGSFLRILNVPARGWGEKSAAALARFAEAERLPLARAVKRCGEIADLPAAARKGGEELHAAFEAIRADAAAKRGDLVDRLLDRIGYLREVEQLYRDPFERNARMENAREMGQSLRNFWAETPEGELADFLREMLLGEIDPEAEKEKSLDRKAVRLITLHSAKGLEFPFVYLAGLQEGLLPHKNALESGDVAEERRLAYVGFTRARRRLLLSSARQRVFRGKSTPLKPSRFLGEIPEELLLRPGRKAAAAEKIDRIRSIRERLG